MKRLGFFIATLILLTGCNRELTKETSLVQFKLPKSVKAKGVNASNVQCFGVNVTGEGIDSQTGECTPDVGEHVGFVSGETVELEVEKGSDRRIELYLMEAEATGECPTWDDTFQTNAKSNYSRAYRVAETTVDINQEVETVDLTVTVPSLTETLLSEKTSCPTGTVQAKLFSNGDVVNINDSSFSPDPSSPTNGAITKSDESTSSSENLFAATHGGQYIHQGVTIDIEAHIQHISLKPDTQDLFGVLADGTIVGIALPGGESIDLTAACPFVTCEIPVWAESFSAGFGTDLFIKDHGGQLYKMTTSGPSALSTTVEPFVSQVVIY